MLFGSTVTFTVPVFAKQAAFGCEAIFVHLYLI